MSWWPLSLILFAASTVDPELENSVRTYWNLLQKGDKVGALRYVVDEGQNLFLNRRTNPFRSWTLDRIEPRSPDEALVTVKVEQLILPAGVYYPMPVGEVWVRQQNGWRLRIRPPTQEQLKRIFSGGATRKSRAPKPGTLEVLPKRVRIHFLDQTQRGMVFVRNGLPEAVHIARVDYDRTRFELLETGESVASGQELRLVFRYIGNETEKPLKSQIRLFVKHGEGDEAKEEVREVPILYNYVSPGARGLLGLTQEKLDRLKRGESIKPVLPSPAAPPPDIPGLPSAVEQKDGGKEKGNDD